MRGIYLFQTLASIEWESILIMSKNQKNACVLRAVRKPKFLTKEKKLLKK